MEDFQLDLIIGEGPAARSVRIDLPPFTLVGATTRSGLITTPLRERFGIPLRLQFYTAGGTGADRAARRQRARPGYHRDRRAGDRPALPRHAARRRAPAAPGARLRHRSPARRKWTPRPPMPRCNRLEVDARASTPWTGAILRCIAENYDGGPVGVETLAAALSEQRDAIEEVIEPYLIQQGLLQRTPRGRMLTASGFRYLGLAVASARREQLELLGDERGGLRPMRKRVHAPSSRSASTTRTPMPAASSTTPTICASPSGRAPSSCARPGPITRACCGDTGLSFFVRRCEVDYLKPGAARRPAGGGDPDRQRRRRVARSAADGQSATARTWRGSRSSSPA